MLPIITFDTQRYDPMLGSTYKVIQSTDTLGRLVKLHNSLLNAGRSQAMTALKELGETAKLELSSDNIDIAKKTIRVALSEFKKGLRPKKNLEDIYSKAIDAARTSEELNKCISKLIKDASSILTFNLQKTNKGQNGPTHLISYTRFSKKYDLPNLRNYVVKWSNWNEICSWRLYDTFSKILSSQIFSIPKAAALDFQESIHECADWNSHKVEDETITHLKQSFLGVVGKSIQIDDLQLMLMEKVKGSNLIDFAETKYPFLKEDQKIDLFRKMGHLAMLDLLVGNTDRLIQTEYDAKTNQYRLEALTANLGNLMIDWDPNEDKLPELYAIDNSVKKELILNKMHKDKYNEFLQYQFKDSIQIVNTIIRSIQKSFDDIAEELLENSNDTLQVSLAKFKSILDDLQKVQLKTAMKNGLEEMLQLFSQDILPFWNSFDALKIKNHLTDNHPELLEAISERFQTFNFTGSHMQFNPSAFVDLLTAIESLSKDGSIESRNAVLKLSKELPDCESLPEKIQEIAKKIKSLSESKDWDPSLSPNAKLLIKICRDYTRSNEPKPDCATKLNFF